MKGSIEKVDKAKSFISKPRVQKNNAFKGTPFVKPNFVDFRSHLIRLSKGKTYCSNRKTNDFVREDYVDKFGTYIISSCKSTALNKHRPKSKWVPKSV